MKTKKYYKDLKKYSEVDFIDWTKLKNKTILITGATGLVGRYFIDLVMFMNNKINLNCKIIGLSHNIQKARQMFDYFDNKFFDYIEQDVCDRIKYKENIDYIIHSASNTSPSQYASAPIETINTNIIGTKNLLDLAVEKKSEKFIFVSSFEVYGNVNNKAPISEHDFGTIDCTILRSCYPESKRLSENMCISYSNEKNVNTSILRLSRVFGPTMNPTSTLSISQFIKCGLNNTDIVLKSDGKQDYSYNYVGDVVTALIKVLIDGDNCEAYNVSDKKFDSQLKEFAELISKWCGKDIIFDIPSELEKKGFSNSVMTILDNSKLKKLGWYCIEDLETKIYDTLNILREERN